MRRRPMDRPAELFSIAKLLLAEEDPGTTAEALFRRVVELCAAERGFIVVKRGGDLEPAFDIGFDRATVSAQERRFSRTLVRDAITAGEPIAAELPGDPRFAELESVAALGRCAVLVAPLAHAGETLGAIYLERAGARPFSDDARDFLRELGDVAGLFLRRAVERHELRRRAASLEHDLFARHDFAGIVTRDAAMLKLLELVAQVAESDAAILVRGETGTGKELIARALHVNSARRARPFVALHCSALPATILESELFGHVRGAFTGAERERAGRVAQADRGTLFLDEVAEIPPEVQAKLLRFLQFGEIQRLGSDRVEKVDVRVVAATHRDLSALIAEGKFRQDLYYRLKVVEVLLPPLRARPGDILLLAERFLRSRWRRAGEPRFTARAAALLAAYPWPGNVRELEHVVERAVLLARAPEIDVELLPPEVAAAPAASAAPVPAFAACDAAELDAARAAAAGAVERAFVDELLRRADGNVSQAARISGIHRGQLQRLIARARGEE